MIYVYAACSQSGQSWGRRFLLSAYFKTLCLKGRCLWLPILLRLCLYFLNKKSPYQALFFHSRFFPLLMGLDALILLNAEPNVQIINDTGQLGNLAVEAAGSREILFYRQFLLLLINDPFQLLDPVRNPGAYFFPCKKHAGSFFICIFVPFQF